MWICVSFEPGLNGSWRLLMTGIKRLACVISCTTVHIWRIVMLHISYKSWFLMLDYGPTLNLLLFLTQIIHNGSICIVYVILCYVIFVSLSTWIFKGRLYIYLGKRSGPRLIQIFQKILCTRSQPQSLNPHYWLYTFTVLAVLIIDNVALLMSKKCCSLLKACIENYKHLKCVIV